MLWQTALFAAFAILGAHGYEQSHLSLGTSQPWDAPLSKDATGNLIFHSLASLLQVKPNSRYPYGHSIVQASIAPGTVLYHGRADSGYPYMDWLAFDAEHSQIFSRGNNGTLFAYSATRELNLLYFDGCSANSLGGAKDAQDILVFGKIWDRDRGEGSDWKLQLERIQETCKWGRKYGVDGYVRMEFNFEIMYCNFEDGLELVSALPIVNAGGSAPPHGPDRPNSDTNGDTLQTGPVFGPVSAAQRRVTNHRFHSPDMSTDAVTPPVPIPPTGWRGTYPITRNAIRHAGSWHNDFPGETRVHVDPSTLVSFYDPALTSLVAMRRRMAREDYRVGNISKQDAVRVREDVVEVIRRRPGSGSGVDWRGLAKVIQDRFAERLSYLRYLLHQPHADVTEQIPAVRKQFFVSLLPYMPRGDTTTAIGAPAWFAEIARGCQTRLTARLPEARFTKQERVLRAAVDEVLHEICRVLTGAWREAFDVEEKSEDVAQGLMERWKDEVDELVEWLDWPVWMKCEPACNVDEFCYVYQRGTPFDSDPDDVDQTPQCLAIDNSTWY